MRKRWILGVVGVLALSLAACGGGDDVPPVTGPGLVGLDDTSDTTAPLLTVTYSLPATPGTVTVRILSDLASDGDIAFDPVLASYFVMRGPSTVLLGIDSLDANLPEYRAFLTFPLDGATGQPIVPGDAIILSANVQVFVNFLDFASAVPTFLDMVQYPSAIGGQGGLGSIDAAGDFNQLPLAFGPAFDFLVGDVGNYVAVPVTSLMQAAQVPRDRLGAADLVRGFHATRPIQDLFSCSIRSRICAAETGKSSGRKSCQSSLLTSLRR
jgi:hypothetical protein